MAKILPEDTCSICFEDSSNKIECGHFFHPECIKGWAEYNSCPVCRAPIDADRPVKKFKADTSEDEDFATQLLFNDAHSLLFADAIFPNPFELDPLVAHLFSRVLQRRRENQNRGDIVASCTQCGTDLYSNDEAISCSKCGGWFYCSPECVEEHENDCPNFVCVDCDEQPCTCDDSSTEDD